jgi:hypothetical protein
MARHRPSPPRRSRLGRLRLVARHLRRRPAREAIRAKPPTSRRPITHALLKKHDARAHPNQARLVALTVAERVHAHSRTKPRRRPPFRQPSSFHARRLPAFLAEPHFPEPNPSAISPTSVTLLLSRSFAVLFLRVSAPLCEVLPQCPPPTAHYFPQTFCWKRPRPLLGSNICQSPFVLSTRSLAIRPVRRRLAQEAEPLRSTCATARATTVETANLGRRDCQEILLAASAASAPSAVSPVRRRVFRSKARAECAKFQKSRPPQTSDSLEKTRAPRCSEPSQKGDFCTQKWGPP